MAGDGGGSGSGGDERANEASARIGSDLKGWKLEKLLGLGPTSAAFEATTAEGERAVVRVADVSIARDERARGQFLRAAYAANRFHHPRVVPIAQDGATEAATFVVRPWEDARPLAEVVGDADAGKSAGAGALDELDVLRMAEQLLDALEMAHAHGIVHGAISPSNVLVTAKRSIRLVDFAVPPGAPSSGTDDKDALAARRVGPFTPPERCRTPPGAAVDASDVWSLGACMYFALTNKAPRDPDAADPATAKVRPLREVAPSVGAAVAAIVDHALEIDPALRYDSAYAMLGDVRRAMAGRKPKLGAALRPVPSGSYQELPLSALTSSRQVPALVPVEVPPKVTASTARRQRQKEWRGNVALIVAIAVLVGVATFVLVREKRSDVAPEPAPAKLYH